MKLRNYIISTLIGLYAIHGLSQEVGRPIVKSNGQYLSRNTEEKVELEDINGDGLLDVIYGGQLRNDIDGQEVAGIYLRTLESNGAYKDRGAIAYVPADDDSDISFKVKDVNGDNLPDIYVSAERPGMVHEFDHYLFINKGNNIFEYVTKVPLKQEVVQNK